MVAPAVHSADAAGQPAVAAADDSLLLVTDLELRR
jgi:hypothetical protein